MQHQLRHVAPNRGGASVDPLGLTSKSAIASRGSSRVCADAPFAGITRAIKAILIDRPAISPSDRQCVVLAETGSTAAPAVKWAGYG
jgi:hypothetical protein